jgi:hypothetical protein
MAQILIPQINFADWSFPTIAATYENLVEWCTKNNLNRLPTIANIAVRNRELVDWCTSHTPKSLQDLSFLSIKLRTLLANYRNGNAYLQLKNEDHETVIFLDVQDDDWQEVCVGPKDDLQLEADMAEALRLAEEFKREDLQLEADMAEALMAEALRLAEELDLQLEADYAEALRLAEEFKREDEEASRRPAEQLQAEWLGGEVHFHECTVCLDSFDSEFMVQLDCQHWYCFKDLLQGFQFKFDDRKLFKCCDERVGISTCPDVSEEFKDSYNLLELELTTINPLYCSNKQCGRFVPPVRYEDSKAAVCEHCAESTCTRCRMKSHGDDLCQDTLMGMAMNLANTNGWKTCPRCMNVVEKSSGCNHITCRCGQEFCYVCGGEWGICRHQVVDP